MWKLSRVKGPSGVTAEERSDHRMASGKELDWGNEGSLTKFYADDRKGLIDKMVKDGWNPCQTPSEQSKWWDTQKQKRMKKAGILLARQLCVLTEKARASIDKITQSQSRS